MSEHVHDTTIRSAGAAGGLAADRRQEALLKTGALHNAIFNSANFSIIATDEKGVIQLFNSGAERMLGYRAAEVVNKLSPSDIHDPQEVMARAQALSLELATSIAPGFQALAFKASRGIVDSYELTYIRKDGSRFPAIVSITALRDDHDDIIGYLLIGAANSVRKQVEAELINAKAEEGCCLGEPAGGDQLLHVGHERMIADQASGFRLRASGFGLQASAVSHAGCAPPHSPAWSM